MAIAEDFSKWECKILQVIFYRRISIWVFSRFDNKIKIVNWKLNIGLIVISSSLSSSKRVLQRNAINEGRNEIMAYTIMRFKKDKGGAIAGCERHNERKKEAYKSNPDIDINKTKDN